LRRGLRALGYAVDQSTSQIIALHSGNDLQTRTLRDALEDRDVFGAVFCAPATPKNHGVIRLSVNARLREDDLNRVIEAFAAIARDRVLDPWPRDLIAAHSAADESERLVNSAVSSLRSAAKDLRRAADRWFDRDSKS
jgi:hypothetical protein